MKTIREIQQLFSERGIKVTPQRIAVYQALRALGHACADEVVEQVHLSAPTISIGTIYNTLDCLLENSLIAKVNTGNNKKYYDINTHPHSHLYCERTHRIGDFDDPGLEEVIRRYIASRPVKGFRLADVKVQLLGEFTD